MCKNSPQEKLESKYVYSTERNQQEVEAVKKALEGTKYDNPIPPHFTEGEKPHQNPFQRFAAIEGMPLPCPSCGEEIETDSPICPKCGRHFHRNMLMWAVSGAIILPLLYWVLRYVNS